LNWIERQTTDLKVAGSTPAGRASLRSHELRLASPYKAILYSSFIYISGEMAERPNAAVLKTVIPRDRNRGFESHSLLHYSRKTPVNTFFFGHKTSSISKIYFFK